ncbi:MAG: FKBP-type peptidyl-prolyl cis-trans isomerase [Acidobacteria bacterium]|nr:FKBP-type peptidyl-prolyl cis-trans isomerase [Acidobacteriota bacterium]
MKRIVAIGMVVLATAAGAAETVKAPFTSVAQQRSYAIGRNIGMNLKQQDLQLDTEQLLKGMKDALGGQPSLLTDAEMEQTLGALQQEMQAKQQATTAAAGAKAAKEGEAFLAANAAKPGVVTLPSGLQYKVVTAGTGKKPAATDTVVVHYRGTLTDGTEFDSSYKRNQPAKFKVNQVIPGWTEALQLMPVGSKWQLVIPAKLAYGERGAGGAIPPNSVLVFEVELQGIE